ncbi:hypothetical protein OK348_06370 [Flavobacterium sp. MXW15]|uniref:Uncharacterized protein n=1 Tax=Xanthomonas chitinilytica TaxID=2989819 RepID=A0ABT3JT34_9XANT|nr:hypothetical protein [Xanthomonas sp. H13-6]MCW4454416.1 hypothetical protein [Flavobacterium sp. MXW15]MCW4471656.1 hypothetical protein [Xanthomonas sp. H13-6]
MRNAGVRLRGWLLCLLALAMVAQADGGKQQVYWAGFAFTGEASARDEAVPHSAAAIDAGGIETLNRQLSSALKRQPPQRLALIDDQLAKLDGSTSATVLAAALDRELVSVEPIAGQYKVLVEVALQALFFDFRERQVIAAYPLTLQRIDLMDYRPDQSEIGAIVSGLIYGSSATDLPQVLAQTLAEARLPNAAVRRLQVGAVTLSDAARQKLPDPSWEAPLRASLAHELTKTLAVNTGIGLLPPATGQAIGGAMAARFADGKVFQLKIPEADYLVQLQVDAFKSGVVSETAAMKQMLFGAFFSVTVTEPYSGKVFFEQPLRKGATKVVPATQWQVDQWSAGYETLLAGFDAFAGAAAGRAGHRAWLDEQKPGGRPLQQQTQALQELIKSCR